MYYSYDPEDGIRFHDTGEEAKARAQKAIEDAEFSAADSDWSWNENEEEISWGLVRGKVAYNDRPLTPEEKADHPDWSFCRSPSLDDIARPGQATNAAIADIAAIAGRLSLFGHEHDGGKILAALEVLALHIENTAKAPANT